MARADIRTAVVTGGANGIGRAVAGALVARGAHVVVADRDGQAATATATTLGERASALPCDVTSDEDVARLAADVDDRLGPPDLVVANAGIAVGGRFEAIPIDAWRRALDVNVLGVVRTVSAFLPAMLERGRGHVAITGSSAGLFVDQPHTAPYAASKWALTGLAQSLWLHARPRGVTVTLLCPRLTDTAFPRSAERWDGEGMQTTADRRVSGADTPEQVADLLLAGVDAGRFLVAADPSTAERLAARAADWDGWLAAHLPT